MESIYSVSAALIVQIGIGLIVLTKVSKQNVVPFASTPQQVVRAINFCPMILEEAAKVHVLNPKENRMKPEETGNSALTTGSNRGIKRSPEVPPRNI